MTRRQDEQDGLDLHLAQVADQTPQESDNGFFVDNLYKFWFLDYASYVILDRAIPDIDDGLKPVQRRILHAMNEIEDGRYNKAAHIIGQAMRFHPHGDVPISEALVKMAEKGLFIDTQGNWGNPITGDDSAAPRYIEARLTPFAKDTVYSDHSTVWGLSYDGRYKEPTTLPIKFPVLLFQGVEGIAVGLSTKILPHNFCELIKESIAILKGYKPKLLPDFPTGGSADFSGYHDGKKGAKVKVRAKIDIVNNKLLKITEIPYGTTTTSLIESILSAHEKGKIKIKKIEDNTGKEVEILVHLLPGVSVDSMIESLYAFSDCELSLSPIACVISKGKPLFCGVSEILTYSTARTKELLRLDLEHEKQKLSEKLHLATLEKIFIENKLYKKIEAEETWEGVLQAITKGLKPFLSSLFRELQEGDVEKLTEIRIKRLSKFDATKADDALKDLKTKLATVEKNLSNLTEFTIQFFKKLLQQYGSQYPRKTRLETFELRKDLALSLNRCKVYLDKKEGFIGTGLKKDEFAFECAENDEWIAFSEEGIFMVGKPEEKTFVGKGILQATTYKKNDERCVYHLIYREGKTGPVLAKRFNVASTIRYKPYSLTKEVPGSKVLYLSINPHGEAEKVQLVVKDSSAKTKSKKGQFEFDFASLPIKDRQNRGTLISEDKVEKVLLLSKGASTLSVQRIWFDRDELNLNTDGKGTYIGKCSGAEKMISLYGSGSFELFDLDLAHRFSEQVLQVAKCEPGSILSVVYYDEAKDDVYVKRVLIDESFGIGRFDFIERSPGNKIYLATLKPNPVIQAEFVSAKKGLPSEEEISLEDIAPVKGLQALGTKLSPKKLKSLSLI
ncbi:MAG: DNA gyrase/topoisomerase IV subunit A [Oligoflexales bacterium]|nr:DNA gyrase/topoisomerase IV subunit A [Oligoflexales bacterium]